MSLMSQVLVPQEPIYQFACQKVFLIFSAIYFRAVYFYFVKFLISHKCVFFYWTVAGKAELQLHSKSQNLYQVLCYFDKVKKKSKKKYIYIFSSQN